jgi:hypothetical protein
MGLPKAARSRHNGYMTKHQGRSLAKFQAHAERLSEVARRNSLWLETDEEHQVFKLTRDGKLLKESLSPYTIEVYLDGYETGTYIVEHEGTDTLD